MQRSNACSSERLLSLLKAQPAPVAPPPAPPAPVPQTKPATDVKMAQQGSKKAASQASEAKQATARAQATQQSIKPSIDKNKAPVQVATTLQDIEDACNEYNQDDDLKSQGLIASKRLLERLGLKRSSAFKIARAVCALATEKQMEGTDLFGELSVPSTAYAVNLIKPENQGDLVPHLYPENAKALHQALQIKFPAPPAALDETKELKATVDKLRKELKDAKAQEFNANSISTFLFSELGKPKCIQLYSAVEDALHSCQQKRRAKLRADFSQGDVVILRNGERGVFNKICRKYARVNMIQNGQVNMGRWWTVHDPESLRKAEGEARMAFPQSSKPNKKSSKRADPNDEEEDDLTDEEGENQPGAVASSSGNSNPASSAEMIVDG